MIRVYGDPAPQGSKRAFVRGGRAVLVESSAKVAPWRAAVVQAVLRHSDQTFSEPVAVTITFIHQRPQSHYGTKQGQPYLKPTSPTFVATTPDLDKLLRSTFDGLTDSGLIDDDKQVVVCNAQKRYVQPGERPGALVHVEPATAS